MSVDSASHYHRLENVTLADISAEFELGTFTTVLCSTNCATPAPVCTDVTVTTSCYLMLHMDLYSVCVCMYECVYVSNCM